MIQLLSSMRRDLPLCLLAAAHLAFMLLFGAVLLLATGAARAETAACAGQDMIAEMERQTPELLARIRSEANATRNGKGLLWRIDKPGLEPSWLFGTMHVTDPRVTGLTPAADEAFRQSSTVVIETLDVLDPEKVTAVMLQRPELMMFTDDTALDTLIPAADRPMVEAALQERGLPLVAIRKMKPWIVSALVALPACEMARKASDTQVLDIALAERARAEGKRLDGLETMQEQLEAMASLPMAFHVEGLVETLRLGSRMDDVIETMVLIYRSGQLGLFWPFFGTVLPSAGGKEGYSQFQHVMVSARNDTMAHRAEPLLERGRTFLAVGALHLPGDGGLVARLQDMGYTLTPLD